MRILNLNSSRRGQQRPRLQRSLKKTSLRLFREKQKVNSSSLELQLQKTSYKRVCLRQSKTSTTQVLKSGCLLETSQKLLRTSASPLKCSMRRCTSSSFKPTPSLNPNRDLSRLRKRSWRLRRCMQHQSQAPSSSLILMLVKTMTRIQETYFKAKKSSRLKQRISSEPQRTTSMRQNSQSTL